MLPRLNGNVSLGRGTKLTNADVLLGCPVSKWGYNPFVKGIDWGYNPLILTFDPNFLGHPSGEWRGVQ